MIRIHIRLEPSQHQRLQALAARRSVSIAQLVREGVDHVLLQAEVDVAWDRLLSVAGTFRAESEQTDVSENHDAYLADAYR